MNKKAFFSLSLLIVPLNGMEQLTLKRDQPTEKNHDAGHHNFSPDDAREVSSDNNNTRLKLHACIDELQELINQSLSAPYRPVVIKVAYRNSEEKKARAASLDSRMLLIFYRPLIDKQQELIKLHFPLEKPQTAKAVEDNSLVRLPVDDLESAKLVYQLAYTSLVSRTCIAFKNIPQSEEWPAVVEAARSRLTKSDPILWQGLIIDSLFELFKDQGITKLIIAIELNENNLLDKWIRGYLEFCSQAGIDNQLNVSLHDTTALISAIRKRDRVTISLLLVQKDLDVAVTTEEGATALSVAALENNVEVAVFLLDRDISLLDRVMTNGYSALHIASSKGHAEIASALLEKKAQTDLKEFVTQMTPLLISISAKHPAIVKLLLEHGADVNAIFNDQSALMVALKMYDLEKSPILHNKEELKKAREILVLILNTARLDKTWRNSKGKNAANFARLLLTSDDTDLSNLINK